MTARVDDRVTCATLPPVTQSTLRPGIPYRTPDRLRVNNRIRARSVRLIDADGKQVGVVPIEEALRQSRLAGLDLVEVSAGAVPPVCRILDYGKYQYEQAKKEKESKKHQKKIEIKGIRLGLRTDDHDRDLKKKKTEEFLSEGDKVRVEIVLRGREKAHRPLASEIIATFLRTVSVPYTVEEPLAQSPRGLATTIAPAKTGEGTRADQEGRKPSAAVVDARSIPS
jgi:translation initiation factor IF-3